MKFNKRNDFERNDKGGEVLIEEKKRSKEYTIIEYVIGIKNIHTYTHTHT